MKVGNLAQLSSYGSNLKMFRYLQDCVGLVVEIMPLSDCYVVEWAGHATRRIQHRRLDLKLVK